MKLQIIFLTLLTIFSSVMGMQQDESLRRREFGQAAFPDHLPVDMAIVRAQRVRYFKQKYPDQFMGMEDENNNNNNSTALYVPLENDLNNLFDENEMAKIAEELTGIPAHNHKGLIQNIRSQLAIDKEEALRKQLGYISMLPGDKEVIRNVIRRSVTGMIGDVRDIRENWLKGISKKVFGYLPSYFDALPREIKQEIFNFVMSPDYPNSRDERKTAGLVNKEWRQQIKNISSAWAFVKGKALEEGKNPIKVAFDYDVAIVVADYLKQAPSLIGLTISLFRLFGMPALTYAALKGSVDVARTLLKNGYTDSVFTDKDVNTLTNKDIYDGLLTIAKQFVDEQVAMQERTQEIDMRFRNEDRRKVAFTLDASILVDDYIKKDSHFVDGVVDGIHSNDYTFLDLVILNRSLHTIKLLLDKGASLNVPNNEHFRRTGKTVLMKAISNLGYTRNETVLTLIDSVIIKLLLDRGADVHRKDNEGKTVFDYNKNEQVKNLLLKYA